MTQTSSTAVSGPWMCTTVEEGTPPALLMNGACHTMEVWTPVIRQVHVSRP